MNQGNYRTPIFRNKLFLTDKSVMHRKSREEGESELEHLAKTAKKEGVWLFIPQNNTWYNLGGQTQEDLSDSSALMTVAMKYFPNMEGITKATHYHIHPTIAFKKISEKVKKQVSAKKIHPLNFLKKLDIHMINQYKNLMNSMHFPQFKSQWQVQRENYALQYENHPYMGTILNTFEQYREAMMLMPSNPDMESFVSITKALPKVKLDFKIISEAGNTTVAINNGDKYNRIAKDYAKLQKNMPSPNMFVDRNIALIENKYWEYHEKIGSNRVMIHRLLEDFNVGPVEAFELLVQSYFCDELSVKTEYHNKGKSAFS